MNPNVRQPEETQKQYRERLRREQASAPRAIKHLGRTVAQDKRDARKARNRARTGR